MDEVKSISDLENLLGVSLSRYYPKGNQIHDGIALSHLVKSIESYVVKGDGLAIEDSCKIISKDPHLPFGKIIKSNLARALKKSTKYITKQDREKIVFSTATLLSLEFCPRETEDYCRLIQKLGTKEIKDSVTSKPYRRKVYTSCVAVTKCHLTSGCFGLVTVGTFSALLRSVKVANCNQRAEPGVKCLRKNCAISQEPI